MNKFTSYEVEYIKANANTHSIKHFAQLFNKSNLTILTELKKHRTSYPKGSRKSGVSGPRATGSKYFNFADYGGNVFI